MVCSDPRRSSAILSDPSSDLQRSSSARSECLPQPEHAIPPVHSRSVCVFQAISLGSDGHCERKSRTASIAIAPCSVCYTVCISECIPECVYPRKAKIGRSPKGGVHRVCTSTLWLHTISIGLCGGARSLVFSSLVAFHRTADRQTTVFWSSLRPGAFS